MILESVILDVRAGEEEAFELAFAEAQGIVASMPGYCSHELLRCVEANSRYLLQIRWTSLEAHTEGFRGSSEYQSWKDLLHHFYEVFPTVEHYLGVLESN
jgi:heme-degrading monooxygenase HmoA